MKLTTMSDQSFRALFYWWMRPESAEECAARIASFLDELRSLHPAYSSWGIFDDDFRFHAMPESPLPALQRALEVGVNRRDTDGSVIEELGFKINFGTGTLRTGGIRIAAHMGCYSKWVVNTFLVGPIKSLERPELVEFSIMLDLARTIIRHMEPDNGTIASDEYHERIGIYGKKVRKVDPGKPTLGWMVYLANDYWPLPALPEGVYHEHIPDRGNLVAVTTETFDVDNPAHVEAAKQFGERLYAVDPRQK